MLDTIFEHRSIRKFKDTPVAPESLKKILEAGTRASNTGNMQVYSIVVSQEESIRKQLWEAHFKQGMVLEAPVHLMFCADLNRFNKWCENRDAKPGYDNFLWFQNACIDAVLASQNVSLAAESFGLGICYLGTATYMADKFVDILDLPKHVIPITALVLGYPDQMPELTDRLPMEGVVHYEKYKNYTDSDIDEIYASREALDQTKELIAQNGTETLAQIFTEKRYKREDNLFFSNKYFDLLKEQGFFNHE